MRYPLALTWFPVSTWVSSLESSWANKTLAVQLHLGDALGDEALISSPWSGSAKHETALDFFKHLAICFYKRLYDSLWFHVHGIDAKYQYYVQYLSYLFNIIITLYISILQITPIHPTPLSIFNRLTSASFDIRRASWLPRLPSAARPQHGTSSCQNRWWTRCDVVCQCCAHDLISRLSHCDCRILSHTMLTDAYTQQQQQCGQSRVWQWCDNDLALKENRLIRLA